MDELKPIAVFFLFFLETVDGVDLEVDSMQMKRLRAGCEDTLLVDLH